MTTPSKSQQDFDTAQVAVALLSVFRLQHAFHRSTSAAERQTLLLAAAEVLDRTVPGADLQNDLKGKSTEAALSLLQERRSEVALVPPGLWHKARVAPNDFGDSASYSAWRALERLQKMTLENASYAERQKAAQVVLTWLTPVTSTFPDLAAEAALLVQPHHESAHA